MALEGNVPPTQAEYLRSKLGGALVSLSPGGPAPCEQETAGWRFIVEDAEPAGSSLLEGRLSPAGCPQSRRCDPGDVVWELEVVEGRQPVHVGCAWYFPLRWTAKESRAQLQPIKSSSSAEQWWWVGVERVTLAILGAGNRGNHYATFAKEHPDDVRLVAVADEKKLRRDAIQRRFDGLLPANALFCSWKEMTEGGARLADAAVISLPDRLHRDAAVALTGLGYHILLEKPMATTIADCEAIVSSVEEHRCLLAVCHVLRYTPYSRKMKELISSGAIGTVTHMQHLEPVGYYHFAHSYVRGNWRQEASSSFSLLTKSCHDLDWISWMMDDTCEAVSSFGSLLHFKEAAAPAEAGSRCIVDCPAAVENSCPYSAVKIYRDIAHQGNVWPVNVIVDDVPNVENVEEALRTGPYGRCVYKSDNDVCDQQVVSLQFSRGATASFSMVAHTKELCVRKTKVFGSLGELEGDGLAEIKHFDFRTKTTTCHHPDNTVVDTQMTRHGYGDYHLMKDFVCAVKSHSQAKILSGPRETLASHALVFAAENARKSRTVVGM